MAKAAGTFRVEPPRAANRAWPARSWISLWDSGPIVILMLVILVVGLALLDDFGSSWDENGDISYGRTALEAYRDPGFDWNAYGKRKYYGPAHFMFQQMVVDTAATLAPEWSSSHGTHLANLIAFEVSVAAIYMLGRRYVSRKAALAMAALFATQPLYFGHGFINGKDTPFMALFLLALALGGKTLDRPPPSRPSRTAERDPEEDQLAQLARRAWETSPTPLRRTILILTGLGIIVLMDRLATRWLFYSPLHAVVRAAYAHQAPGWLNDLFDRMAQRAGDLSVDVYVSKATRALDGLLATIAVALLVGSLMLLAWALRSARHELWRQMTEASLAEWIRSRYILWLVCSGMAVGLLNSVRPVGLLALLLLGVVGLWRWRARALLPLAFMGLVAALTCYLSWPFLWQRPLGRFLDSIQFLAGNPNRDYVLYMGEVTKGRLLPWHYLPTLMLLQFTEPMWILALLGTLALSSAWRAGRRRVELALLLPLWLLVPTVPLILAKAWFYDNFRQFLFVTPVFLLLAAHGFDWILARIRLPALHWVVVALAIAPGILAIARLHPYEYVYYNGLVGGTRGAARRFELDYWATSYSEAIRRVNETAPPGASVAFLGTLGPAQPYARQDLQLLSYNFDQDPSTVPAQILVATTRANADLDLQRFTRRIGEITVDSAVLTVIRSR